MTAGRQTTPEEQITAAFTEAWIKCMTEHDGNLVTGPCSLCAAEAGERLRKESGDA